jgi:hypothetical protein
MKKKAAINQNKNTHKMWYHYLQGYGIFGIAALFWIWILSVGTYKRYNNYRLFHYGKVTKAWVTNKEYKGLRGTKGYYYVFSVNNETIVGHTIYQHNYTIADSIKVYYLENNPQINQDSLFIVGFFD